MDDVYVFYLIKIVLFKFVDLFEIIQGFNFFVVLILSRYVEIVYYICEEMFMFIMYYKSW